MQDDVEAVRGKLLSVFKPNSIGRAGDERPWGSWTMEITTNGRGACVEVYETSKPI